MSDTHRHIEVVSPACVIRTVESYQATIELTVTTRKKKACLNESLALRDQTISALHDAGIGAEHIEDGGSKIEQSSWSSSKTIAHKLHVRHPEMSVLVQAMTNIERVFAAKEQSWFSGVKHDFSFSGPIPEFADDLPAVEEALKKAITNAKTRAMILAQEADLELGDVLSIIEQTPQRMNRNWHQDPDIDGLSGDLESVTLHSVDTSANYTPTAPRQGTACTNFRVRFAVKAS